MKSIFTTITFSIVMVLGLGLTAFAAPPVSEATTNTEFSSLSLEQLKTITPKQYKELTGKKLNVAQIAALKLTQHKLKKAEARDGMDGKTIGIIAHLTLIGWIIALVMNSDDKRTELGSFYIRQTLGLMLLGIICGVIPIVGWILAIGVFVLWIISLLGALKGEQKEVPLVGSLFQEWFKGL